MRSILFFVFALALIVPSVGFAQAGRFSPSNMPTFKLVAAIRTLDTMETGERLLVEQDSQWRAENIIGTRRLYILSHYLVRDSSVVVESLPFETDELRTEVTVFDLWVIIIPIFFCMIFSLALSMCSYFILGSVYQSVFPSRYYWILYWITVIVTCAIASWVVIWTLSLITPMFTSHAAIGYLLVSLYCTFMSFLTSRFSSLQSALPKN